MKKGPFKLRSGNKPSMSKVAGISPMKELSESDKETIKRKKEIRDNANKAIREGKLKPLSNKQLKDENISKDLDKFNYYKFGDTIITKLK